MTMTQSNHPCRHCSPFKELHRYLSLCSPISARKHCRVSQKCNALNAMVKWNLEISSLLLNCHCQQLMKIVMIFISSLSVDNQNLLKVDKSGVRGKGSTLWLSGEVGRLTMKRPHNVHTTSAHISWVLRTTSTQHRHTMSTWHTVGAHNVRTTSMQRPRNVGTTSMHSRHTDWLLAGTFKVFTNRLLAGY